MLFQGQADHACSETTYCEYETDQSSQEYGVTQSPFNWNL